MGAPRFPYDFGMLRDTTDSPSAGATVSADVTSVDSSIPGTPNARNTETVLDDKLSKKSARVDESTGDVIKL